MSENSGHILGWMMIPRSPAYSNAGSPTKASLSIPPSGAQAFAIARDHAPDLAILDVMLPGADGYEVLARLRAADSDLPVIMLTARDAASDQVKGLESGADDYVVKPFSFAILAARVKALLARRVPQRDGDFHGYPQRGLCVQNATDG